MTGSTTTLWVTCETYCDITVDDILIHQIVSFASPVAIEIPLYAQMLAVGGKMALFLLQPNKVVNQKLSYAVKYDFSKYL